eukprot:CAMPEP_0181326486 /NCGR_PEP_ID=MMETSP1101-20121128/21525_1 /TAXON_ID=46948 /ORGANISM="Rhodomonas abbreviata, Strain Caron Lab Isolate" /LENGTH=43 /DNA_ID= /DNA_START= /DNA_END= /DNA_ORIENTATION=
MRRTGEARQHRAEELRNGDGCGEEEERESRREGRRWEQRLPSR